jgi:hypothetical protein
MASALQIVADSRRIRLWLRAKAVIKTAIGWCLERFKAPAKLRPFEFVDPATDETVYLYTSKRYSVFCVGDRRFYFDRASGNFDGTSAPAGVIPGWVEFSDELPLT